LKKVGWKGFVDGADSGVYKATPLSRLNASDGMATPLAQKEYERMYERSAASRQPHSGHAQGSPGGVALRHRTVGSNWLPIPKSPENEYRVLPTQTPTEGIGCVEAPRGTLTHHYATDERGILTKSTSSWARPTTMPHQHVHCQAAKGLIKKGKVPRHAQSGRNGLRAYDTLLRLRHPLPPRPDAPGGGPAQPDGRGLRNASAKSRVSRDDAGEKEKDEDRVGPKSKRKSKSEIRIEWLSDACADRLLV
jgi:F420-non-reducing hydrogenase large subunit